MSLTTRRAVLCGTAAACGAAALSACSSSRGGGSGSAPSAAPGGVLARLDDVPVGKVVSAATPEGDPVLLARTSETEVTAVSPVCTHEGCTVEPSGECPCHGSRFDPRTGEVLGGPAGSALGQVAVQVVDGEVRTS